MDKWISVHYEEYSKKLTQMPEAVYQPLHGSSGWVFSINTYTCYTNKSMKY